MRLGEPLTSDTVTVSCRLSDGTLAIRESYAEPAESAYARVETERTRTPPQTSGEKEMQKVCVWKLAGRPVLSYQTTDPFPIRQGGRLI